MQSRIPNSVFLPKPFSLSDLTATVQGQLHLVAEPRAITAGGQAGPMLL